MGERDWNVDGRQEKDGCMRPGAGPVQRGKKKGQVEPLDNTHFFVATCFLRCF